MKVYSDTLTERDLRAALPAGVHAYITERGARKRARCFDVTLYVAEKDELHRRFGNSGGYGAKDDVAATWDEWGLWLAALYFRDAEALCGYYESPEHFVRETRRYRDYVRETMPPTSLAARTHKAPWLVPIEDRLEELRAAIRGEEISYGEIAELQAAAGMIDPGDAELLEWAGVPEGAAI